MTGLYFSSEVGDEAVLNILWDRYEKAIDKVCLDVYYFLKFFIPKF